MTRSPSLTASADLEREIPAAAAEQLDRIRVALESLDGEERRLLLLGFETPLERCREQRRYWTFLEGVFALAAENAETGIGNGGRSWPVDPSR